MKAADVLAAHGQADAAIAQLIDASAWDEVLALLVAHAERFVTQGRTETVRDWILALPEGAREVPHASYWLVGYCEMATDPANALRPLERAHQGFVAAAGRPGVLAAAAKPLSGHHDVNCVARCGLAAQAALRAWHPDEPGPARAAGATAAYSRLCRHSRHAIGSTVLRAHRAPLC